MNLLKRKNQAEEQLRTELSRISELLEITDINFNEAEDSLLIEAAIYDRSALLARHAYLTKKLRGVE